MRVLDARKDVLMRINLPSDPNQTRPGAEQASSKPTSATGAFYARVCA